MSKHVELLEAKLLLYWTVSKSRNGQSADPMSVQESLDHLNTVQKGLGPQRKLLLLAYELQQSIIVGRPRKKRA